MADDECTDSFNMAFRYDAPLEWVRLSTHKKSRGRLFYADPIHPENGYWWLCSAHHAKYDAVNGKYDTEAVRLAGLRRSLVYDKYRPIGSPGTSAEYNVVHKRTRTELPQVCFLENELCAGKLESALLRDLPAVQMRIVSGGNHDRKAYWIGQIEIGYVRLCQSHHQRYDAGVILEIVVN